METTCLTASPVSDWGFLMFLGINVSQTWSFLVDYYLIGASEEADVIQMSANTAALIKRLLI